MLANRSATINIGNLSDSALGACPSNGADCVMGADSRRTPRRLRLKPNQVTSYYLSWELDPWPLEIGQALQVARHC